MASALDSLDFDFDLNASGLEFSGFQTRNERRSSGIQWISTCNSLDPRIEKKPAKTKKAHWGSRQNLQLAPNLIPRAELRQATREYNEGPAHPAQERPEPGSLTIDTITREAAWGRGLPAPPLLGPRGAGGSPSACRMPSLARGTAPRRGMGVKPGVQRQVGAFSLSQKSRRDAGSGCLGAICLLLSGLLLTKGLEQA